MQQVKTIGVVGGGVVGAATAASYRDSYDVRVYDVLKDRATHTWHEVLSCDIVFVCLPTPANPDGSCNTDAPVSFFGSLSDEGRQRNFVLRSTVPIGFTRRTAELMKCPNLVHSPEFLTARTAEHDAANPRINVIGMPDRYKQDVQTHTCPDGGTVQVNFPTQLCYRALKRLYEERFPSAPVLPMSSNESEAVKLAMNGFFAVKVAYWNEIYHLCKRLGCDYNAVREAILAEGRVYPLHTQVPGPDGKLGFGGACLPKDLASLWYQLEHADLANNVTTAALTRNARDRKRTP